MLYLNSPQGLSKQKKDGYTELAEREHHCTFPAVSYFECDDISMTPVSNNPVLYVRKTFCTASSTIASFEIVDKVWGDGITNARQHTTAVMKRCAYSFARLCAPRIPDSANVRLHMPFASMVKIPRFEL